MHSAHISSVDHLVFTYFSCLFIFIGNYNLTDIFWLNDKHGLCYSISSSALNHSVPEWFFLHQLFQLNTNRNFHVSLLDLFLTNSSNVYVCVIHIRICCSSRWLLSSLINFDRSHYYHLSSSISVLSWIFSSRLQTYYWFLQFIQFSIGNLLFLFIT